MKITPTNDAALPNKSRMIGYLVPSVIRAARPSETKSLGQRDAPHLASVFPVDKCAGTGTQIHDSICPVSVAFNCRMMAADCLGVRGELKVRLLVAHRNIKSANGEAFTGLDIFDDLGGALHHYEDGSLCNCRLRQAVSHRLRSQAPAGIHICLQLAYLFFHRLCCSLRALPPYPLSRTESHPALLLHPFWKTVL